MYASARGVDGRRNRMGRVQHPRIERQRRNLLRGTLPRGRLAPKGTTQGRQKGTTQEVGKVGRVGRHKVCWVGRHARVRGAEGAAVRQSKTGLTTYDYDLLVRVLALRSGDRHDAIEWVQKHVLPLSDLAKPALRIIYKKD